MHVIAHTAHQNSHFLKLEAKDCNENGHEGGDGRCQQNDIIGLGIACGQCVFLRAKAQIFLEARSEGLP